jgi:transposase
LDPLLPDPLALQGRGGRREEHCRRTIVDAWLYFIDNGNKWRALPKDFPPWQTVNKMIKRWERTGTSQKILDTLRGRERMRQGRAATATAGSIDSQSVKADATVEARTRGFDAGKKINGRKRHLVVDVLGLLIAVVVSPASVHDVHGAKLAIRQAKAGEPRLVHLWADNGYRGKLLAWALSTLAITIQIVKRGTEKGFKVLPRRWVIERSNAWTLGARRLVRDYERLPATSEAIIRWRHAYIMLRRLARNPTKPDTANTQ